jgi:Family of unknown function (DUF6152)
MMLRGGIPLPFADPLGTSSWWRDAKINTLGKPLETPMNLSPIGFAGMALVMCAIPATAHHSFAMFDAEKTVSIEGTVKEFQWTNPHSWIHLFVNDREGKPVLWSIELGAPTGLARQGWVPKTITPGMNVKLLIHPLRDGFPGGQFLHATLPDGKQLGDPSIRERQGGAQGERGP